MSAVPYTAFCPDCNGHRTFTVIGHGDSDRADAGALFATKVGCCVCGTTERAALAALTARMGDDRDTQGEMAARVNTLDGEIAELRDELHALAVTFRRHQDNHLRAALGDGPSLALAPEPGGVDDVTPSRPDRGPDGDALPLDLA